MKIIDPLADPTTHASPAGGRMPEAARLYWENWGKLGYFNAKGVSIPVAVKVFPDELYPAPRSWAERAFPKLIRRRLHTRDSV